MADQRAGGIAWTEQTWNPVRGCSRVSAGCANCYAERVAARFSGEGQPYHGLAVLDERGARWTGKVQLVEEHLEDPIRWKRPRRVFVNSMSDLFHEDLADESIFRVFKAMAAAPQHVFQVLTKRADRMRAIMPQIRHHLVDRLEHVWLGVSVENQEWAEKRIPDLLATSAAVRWISAEPLLGPLALRPWFSAPFEARAGLDWIVVGGESGPGAREMQIEWARDIVIGSLVWRVPVFVKQLGTVAAKQLRLADRKGGDLAEFPGSLRFRQFPRSAAHG